MSYDDEGTEAEIFRANDCRSMVTVVGVISDSDSREPIEGSIIKTDQNDSAISGSDGKYEIIICDDSEIMNVSSDGYKTAFVSLEENHPESDALNISLKKPGLSDVILVLKILAGVNNDPELPVADLNGDGKADLRDSIHILQKLAEM